MKYIVDRQQYKGTHCYVSMTHLISFTLLTATYRLTTTQRKCILLLPWQQRLRERATKLRYTYTILFNSLFTPLS